MKLEIWKLLTVYQKNIEIKTNILNILQLESQMSPLSEMKKLKKSKTQISAIAR